MTCQQIIPFLTSSFRRFLNVVFFLLGDSPAFEFYVPKFRDTLSAPSSPMKMELTECSETSARKIRTPGNHPKERIQNNTVPVRKTVFLQMNPHVKTSYILKC